jgi:hypothetical protein
VKLSERNGNQDGDDSSLDSDDRAEREEEREKARTASLSLAEEGGDAQTVNASVLNKLIEKLGTLYCEEEH